MYNLLSLIAGLAAVASAAPVAQSSSATDAALAQAFSLKMQVSETNQTLNTYYNATSNRTVLVGKPVSDVAGSAVFVNGTSPEAALNTVIDGETYGLFVSDVGEVYGLVESVGVQKGWQDFEWSVNHGYVYHKLWAASNLFMACNRTLDDETVQVLSFGVVDDNGSVPAGCVSTSVFQTCDIPGSDATC